MQRIAFIFVFIICFAVSAQTEKISSKINISTIPTYWTVNDGSVIFNQTEKKFQYLDGDIWKDLEIKSKPIYAEYGTNPNVLIWLNQGSTSLPEWVRNKYSQFFKIIVLQFEVPASQLEAVNKINKDLAYFIRNKNNLNIEALYLGSNSLGAGYVMNAVNNHHYPVDGLIIYYPQSTWHMDKFSSVLTEKFPSFNPAPYEKRFAIQLYGTETPTADQKDALDFLKPNHFPLWIYSYKASIPNSMDNILHNKLHADIICKISTNCHLNEPFMLPKDE